MRLRWVSAEEVEEDGAGKLCRGLMELWCLSDGVSGGAEGKISAINYARINKIPFLGLCYGMQLACIEFSRNVVGLKDANTTENDPETSIR